MIDIYEIRFKDSDSCIIKICKEDEHGNAVTELDVCLRYKDSWETAVSEHISNFFSKHPDVKSFDEEKDTIRFLDVYKIVTEDGSQLTVDAIDKVKELKAIKQAKKHQ